MFTRYAVYVTPASDSALAAFGASWLGWDSAAGTPLPHPQVPVDVATITATPRRYGFHGTVKPPFRLAKGKDEAGLQSALSDLCQSMAPVTLPGLRLARLGRFLALVPDGDATDLGALAARVVQELDPFRAPPTGAELAKRRASGLTAAQNAHLERWGYPYVLDQFRFHMTLTGRLDKDTAAATEAALTPHLDQLPLAPFRIDALTLLGEDGAGFFHEISRHGLTG